MQHATVLHWCQVAIIFGQGLSKLAGLRPWSSSPSTTRAVTEITSFFKTEIFAKKNIQNSDFVFLQMRWPAHTAFLDIEIVNSPIFSDALPIKSWFRGSACWVKSSLSWNWNTQWTKKQKTHRGSDTVPGNHCRCVSLRYSTRSPMENCARRTRASRSRGGPFKHMTQIWKTTKRIHQTTSNNFGVQFRSSG